MNTSSAVNLSSLALVFLCCASTAQVSSNAPEKWLRATNIGSGGATIRSEVSVLDLPYNRPQQICQELLDEDIVRLIAKRSGLKEAELCTLDIAPSRGSNSVTLYQLRKPDKAFTIMSEQLCAYSRAREEGHTKGFMLAALTNVVPPLSIPDIDLRILVLNRPFIPVAWVRKIDSGTSTNKAGQIAASSTVLIIKNGQVYSNASAQVPSFDEQRRWITYAVADGEIEWLYVLTFNLIGRLEFIEERRRDARRETLNSRR